MSELQRNLRIWAEHIIATIGCPQVLGMWLERGEAIEQVQKVLRNMYDLGVREAREGVVDMGALKCEMPKGEVPTCPKCGEPARVVVILKARVRCELLPEGKLGRVFSASKGGQALGYECGGRHEWLLSKNDKELLIWEH